MTIPFEHRLVMTCRLASLFLLVRETAAVCMTCNYLFVISLFLQFDRTCIYIYVLQTCRAFVFCVPSDRCVLHEITLLFQSDLFSYSHISTVYTYIHVQCTVNVWYLAVHHILPFFRGKVASTVSITFINAMCVYDIMNRNVKKTYQSKSRLTCWIIKYCRSC